MQRGEPPNEPTCDICGIELDETLNGTGLCTQCERDFVSCD